ncbi:MAG TPA: hypothetical protein VGN17_23895 [Bryobacteraceae bacterium]
MKRTCLPRLAFVLAAVLPAIPALAQVDLSGTWLPAPAEDLTGNPDLVDYTGIPINDAARQWALSWDPDRLALQEHQCQVHTAAYIYGGPLRLRIWEERDPQSQNLVALHNYISTYEQNRTIYLDDRPHPPDYAPHTWMGFSTAKWEGNILTVYTTHIKQGWFRRNGVPSSDQITLTEHFIRHGNYLTHVSVVTDPVYLSEPLVKLQDYTLSTTSDGNWLWPCEYVDELPGTPRSAVPSYMPGENPFVSEFAAKYQIPVEAALGGPETMYPEFRNKIKTLKPPAKTVPTAGAR